MSGWLVALEVVENPVGRLLRVKLLSEVVFAVAVVLEIERFFRFGCRKCPTIIRPHRLFNVCGGVTSEQGSFQQFSKGCE